MLSEGVDRGPCLASPCLETLPCNILRTPPAKHCLDTLGYNELCKDYDCNGKRFKESFALTTLVAQCSATPATVPATPPCSATPFQTQISVRHLPGMGGGGRCDTKIFRGCGATPLLHLQNAIKSRKSTATRVARQV